MSLPMHAHSQLDVLKNVASLQAWMTPQELAEIDSLLLSMPIGAWIPQEGPQTEAYYCQADELFYGGAAGGGKTDLILGLAIGEHHTSIIFRREYPQLKGIRERANQIYGKLGKYNGGDELWRIYPTEQFPSGQVVEFGACQHEEDKQKYQGRPHDLCGFDEITHFTETQYRFLIGWNRPSSAAKRNQRTRVVAAGNPPTDAEGYWVVKRWAPWIDPTHPNPAKPGELRWYIVNGAGEDEEVPGPGDYPLTDYDGNPIMDNEGKPEYCTAKSRTFIRSFVENNRYLMEAGYRATLQQLPEPLRSRMLKGDFGVGEDDNEWQVIPTAWVQKAQARWAPTYEAYVRKWELTQEIKKAQDLAKALRDAVTSGNGSNQSNQSNPQPTLGPSAPTNAAGIDAARSLVTEPNVHIDLTELDNRTPQEILASIDMGSSREGLPLFVKDLENFRRERVDLGSDARANEPGARAVGADISRGGRDFTVFTERRGNWFAPQICLPGKQTPTGVAVVQTLIQLGYEAWPIHMDVSTIGSSPVDIGRMEGLNIVAINPAEASIAKDRSGKLGFANARSEHMWKLREALDPDHGFDLAIPPDPELLADLTSARWKLTRRGIQIEDKRDIKKRIGRSPDKGDSLICAFAVPYLAGEGFLQYYKSEVDRQRAELEARNKAKQDQEAPNAAA